MGQQQLLLVILVTIIVGIATVVAINTFGSAADSANRDAVRQDIASIAASAQGYYMKPTALGGGSNKFTGLTFDDLAFGSNGITTNGLEAQNENGSYTIAVSPQSIAVTANPSSDDAYVAGAITGGELTAGTDATDQITATINPDELVMN